MLHPPCLQECAFIRASHEDFENRFNRRRHSTGRRRLMTYLLHVLSLSGFRATDHAGSKPEFPAGFVQIANI
jgi:hypothetical protein